MTARRTESSDWALVTVTHNSADDLRRCWTRARRGGAAWIVVDNDSKDDSVAVARTLGARVVKLGQNVGFSAANNVGLELVDTEFTAFVNPDVIIRSAGDLERLGSTCLRTGGIVAPQLEYLDGASQLNGRGLPFILDKLAHRSVCLPGARLHEYARAIDGHPTYVAWVMGAAVAAQTRIFRELGGWDDRFFVYYEDHDLGLRAWAAGYSVLVDPSVRWAHAWRRATTAFRWQPWRHELRSAVTFYRRYPWLLGRRMSHNTSEVWRPLREKLWTSGRY